MPEPPASIEAWYHWILGTIVTVVSTLVATIVTMAKAMESKYKQEITELKEEMKVVNKHVEDCNRDREEHRVRLAALEATTGLKKH